MRGLDKRIRGGAAGRTLQRVRMNLTSLHTRAPKLCVSRLIMSSISSSSSSPTNNNRPSRGFDAFLVALLFAYLGYLCITLGGCNPHLVGQCHVGKIVHGNVVGYHTKKNRCSHTFCYAQYIELSLGADAANQTCLYRTAFRDPSKDNSVAMAAHPIGQTVRALNIYAESGNRCYSTAGPLATWIIGVVLSAISVACAILSVVLVNLHKKHNLRRRLHEYEIAPQSDGGGGGGGDTEMVAASSASSSV